VRQGSTQHIHACSALLDNAKKLKTPLKTVLLENLVDITCIANLATSCCLCFSAIDALSLEFKVHVILDATTGGILEDGVTAVVADTKVKCAIIADSATVLNAAPLLWSNRKVDNCGRFDGCPANRGQDLRCMTEQLAWCSVMRVTRCAFRCLHPACFLDQSLQSIV